MVLVLEVDQELTESRKSDVLLKELLEVVRSCAVIDDELHGELFGEENISVEALYRVQCSGFGRRLAVVGLGEFYCVACSAGRVFTGLCSWWSQRKAESIEIEMAKIIMHLKEAAGESSFR